MLFATLTPAFLAAVPILGAGGVALLMAWAWLPRTPRAAARRWTWADLAESLWPSWEGKYSAWRSSTALVSAVLGAWIGSRAAGPAAAAVLALLLSIVVPRIVRTLLQIPANDYPMALILIEEVRDVMLRGQSAREAFRRMEERRDAVARLARDVNVSVERHEPLARVLRDLAAGQGTILQQTLEQLALFIDEGYWGPTGVPVLDHIKRSIDARRRLDDTIRAKTSSMRRFRNGALLLIPVVDFLLSAMNGRLYPPFLHTTFGAACIGTAAVLFLLLIFLPLWLAPSPEIA